MWMMYLLYIFSVVFIRFFAGLDSRFQNSKYITIENNMLRMILIDEMSFFHKRKRPKADLNKITLSGLAYYAFSLAVLIVNVVFLCFVRDITIEPWIFETRKFFIYVDSLNEMISAIAILFLFLAVILRLTLELIRCGKYTVEQKWVKILIYISAFVIASAVFFTAVFIIKELVVRL